MNHHTISMKMVKKKYSENNHLYLFTKIFNSLNHILCFFFIALLALSSFERNNLSVIYLCYLFNFILILNYFTYAFQVSKNLKMLISNGTGVITSWYSHFALKYFGIFMAGFAGITLLSFIYVAVHDFHSQFLYIPVTVLCFTMGLYGFTLDWIVVFKKYSYVSGDAELNYSTLSEIVEVQRFNNIFEELITFKIYSNDKYIGFDKMFKDDYEELLYRVKHARLDASYVLVTEKKSYVE